MYRLIAVATILAAAPGAAFGMDLSFEDGLHISLSSGAAFRVGTSYTTDGGASFGKGGVVSDVRFAPAISMGGEIGYRFGPSMSAFVSVDHVEGAAGWMARYAGGILAHFNGRAASDIIMGNVRFTLLASEKTSIDIGVGAGVALNTLRNVTESDAWGSIYADVHDRTLVKPAARLSVGLQHELAPSVLVGAAAALSYVGGFSTADTRDAGLGAEPIKPYVLSDVWSASVTASLKVRF